MIVFSLMVNFLVPSLAMLACYDNGSFLSKDNTSFCYF